MELNKQFEEILEQHIGDCTCDEMYKSRDMIAPNCCWHNELEGMLEAMQKAYDLAAPQSYTRAEVAALITKVLDEAAERVGSKWDGAHHVIDEESITNINVEQYLTK